MSLEELQALRDRLESLFNDLQTQRDPRERLRLINELNGLLYLLKFGNFQR